MSELDDDIEKAKNELREKAKNREIWENFGQDKMREIAKKHGVRSYHVDERADKLDRFSKWCRNFSLDSIF